MGTSNLSYLRLYDCNEMRKLKNVHPGHILKTDFLDEMGISQHDLANAIGVEKSVVEKLIAGEIAVSPHLATALGKFFGVSPEFWLSIQRRFDIEKQLDNKS